MKFFKRKQKEHTINTEGYDYSVSGLNVYETTLEQLKVEEPDRKIIKYKKLILIAKFNKKQFNTTQKKLGKLWKKIEKPF